jgi:hypothetical protein
VIPSERNSERLTRKRLIDPKLKAAGWKIIPFSPQTSLLTDDPCAIEEFETTSGPADYALCVDGHIVGIVEAKKLAFGPQSMHYIQSGFGGLTGFLWPMFQHEITSRVTDTILSPRGSMGVCDLFPSV